MSNLRIVYDNLVDRGTVTASSTAGALVAANLQTDTKSDVWRATGTAASIYAAWPAADSVQAVALIGNFSPTATMRVRLTNEVQRTNLLLYSERFENSAWVKNNVSVTQNASAAPGGSSAGLLASSNAGNDFVYQSPVVASSVTVACSVFIKNNNAAASTLMLRTASTAMQLTINWSGSTLSSLTNNVGVITSSFAAVPNMPGWYRVIVVAITSEANQQFRIYPDAGSTGKSTYGWGAMLEVGNDATSYYPSLAAAGLRPIGYIDNWQTYAYDSGTQLACPAPALRPRGWTAAQAASAYAYGGGAYARMWLPTAMQATGVAVDIVDVNNLQGYIEAARLIVGPYWSPTYNASGATMTPVDTTEMYRTDAGDQGADAGYIYRRVPIDLSLMPAADRAAFVSIVRNSRAFPILVTVFPEVADLVLERDHMVYGRRSKNSDVAIEYARFYSTTIEIEEI